MSSVVHREGDPVLLLFASLAHPVRATIIHRLVEGPAAVSDLVELLQISQPLVSHHLRSLREANLVEGVREGRHVRYRLSGEHVAHVFLDAYTHTKEHHHG